MSEFTANR